MLCDQIVSDGLKGEYDPKLMQPLMAKIERAQKFVLSADFAQAADELSHNLKDVVRALPFCRLPYPLTWFEVVQRERPGFMAGRPPAAWETYPTRVGYLCEATRSDLSAWKMHLMWHVDHLEEYYEGGSANIISAMAVDLDLKRPLDPKCVERDDSHIIAELKKCGLTDQEIMARPEREASDVMASVYRAVPPDCGLPAEIGLLSDVDPTEVAHALYRMAVRDWAGEMQYLYATLALLNARNASETITVDHTEHNRKRQKRGQTPLFSHKVLSIHPRQKARLRATEADYGHDPTGSIRRHFVRGHWKVRRSGVYFWRPFVRGRKSSGAVNKTYVVD